MADSKKVLIVFGTRPEAIKMAPLILEFKKYPDSFDVKVCVTAQHREMLDQVMAFFGLTADFDLNVMRPNQGLAELTSNILLGMQPVFESFVPDYTFVHGDTTTTMAASLAAFYNGSKICHIEAGLRTNDLKSPYPEEANRQITGRLTDIHFSPTFGAKENLEKENVAPETIFVTGNTVIDALFYSVDKIRDYENEVIKSLKLTIGNREMILVTGHRRENHGQGFVNICEGLKEIAEQYPELVIVYPVHLNPNVQKPVYEILGNVSNIKLIHPMEYPDFIWVMNRAKLIITDSGGVQEEAPSLGKPVLVMRDTTERPEAVSAGTVRLVGTLKEVLVKEVKRLIEDEDHYRKMSEAHNPYGNGKASERVVQIILGQ